MAEYKRILIVEDEPTFRAIVVRNLRARGYEVREAATAKEAMAALSGKLPDILLLDLNLPDRSGWDVLRQLRAEKRSVPTVIVSAVRVSQERLDEFAPVAYLPKPFPLEALLRVVEGQPATPFEDGQ